MPEVWTHPTAIDTATTFEVAQCVRRLPPPGGDWDDPLVPTITVDLSLYCLAGFIIALDVVDRLNAYSLTDVSGGTVPGCTHIAFATVKANRGFDVEAALADFIEDRRGALPGLASAGEFRGLMSVDSIDPRGTVGAVLPEMRRMPSGRYSRDAAVRRGMLLNQARAVQHARSVAIDAGLAATCAANWAAARAAQLARLQALYPERGYT